MNDVFTMIKEKTVTKIFTRFDEIDQKIEQMSTKKNKALSEQWLDNQDVMEALRISPRTLQNMRDNGTLKYSKVGGKIYYKSADVEHLLEVGYNG